MHPAELPPDLVDRPVVVQYVDRWQRVTSPDLEIVRVVCRRYLDGAGAESGIDVLVGDNRQLNPPERVPDGPAH